MTWNRYSDNNESGLYFMAKFAVIKTGGKQYVLRPADKIKIEKIDTPVGGEVVFDDILLVSESDKETEIKLGTASLSGYTVKGKVLSEGRGKKLIVYKYKPKKRYHRKRGHRQQYTEVEITEISKNKR